MANQELRDQADCWQWWVKEYPAERLPSYWLRRIKNELDSRLAKQHQIAQLMENKATGIVPGTSDFLYLYPKRIIFIEGKTEHGNMSPAQRDFRSLCVAQGFDYYLYHSIENFKQIMYGIHRQEW